jgi:hypothetical protein
MPKKDCIKKRVIGISEAIYLKIEKYAKQQQPQLFLYEVIEKMWKEFEKKHKLR